MNAVAQGHERVITLADAIREGITESFAKDDSTFLFAQGVSDPSSMWGTLKGIGNRCLHISPASRSLCRPSPPTPREC